MFRAADEYVGLNPDFTKLRHTLLSGLGFQFSRRIQERHQRDMDKNGVAATGLKRELTHGLEEGEPLDVACRPSYLSDENVDILAGRPNPGLDLVRHVGDDLHRSPQVLATALLLDHRLIDLAGGQVVELAELAGSKPFVVPQIEIGLRPVVQNVDLAVLERVHRPWIHIQVWVELLDPHADPPFFEQGA